VIITSPLLARLSNVRHAFFTREGGVSEGIYESLNGGLGSKDDPARVMENRRRMAETIGAPPSHFLTAYQIHSPDVAIVTGPWPSEVRPHVDALVTNTAGIALGVTTADCGPLLFADPKARVIGTAHAGWKGAFGGVIEATLEAMEKLGAARADICVAIGPLIRQASYEVGTEFVDRFGAADATNSRYFIPSVRSGHAMFDLAGYIRHRLDTAGICTIDDVGLDTYADRRFFSYRRSVHASEPDYGRNIHTLMLTP
jgi:YfiH family protein